MDKKSRLLPNLEDKRVNPWAAIARDMIVGPIETKGEMRMQGRVEETEVICGDGFHEHVGAVQAGKDVDLLLSKCRLSSELVSQEAVNAEVCNYVLGDMLFIASDPSQFRGDQ